MKKKDTKRKAAEVFPPGIYIREELKACNWTVGKLAEMSGRPVREINDLIMGHIAVSPEMAGALARAFGSTQQFWLNLETAYQASKREKR